MVDFASIRPHHGSQNNGFEELVVQLVRRRPPPDGKEFRRIEGAGGDAGVEALWIKNDGSAIGVQAKYFLRVRNIDWAQIDESVAATLKHRPEVNVYQVAIACDLTDKGGAKGRGRTGWAAWDEQVGRWEAEALALGRKVTFEVITASDLVDWLGQPSAAGLARYWFGTDVLGLPWFASHVR
ncbi:MAG: ATP-binding protein, partial [Phenylobacterium sp.]|nr:ATP-binding protein [Phenylobacterium sp.]